jgi:hypothetical protein
MRTVAKFGIILACMSATSGAQATSIQNAFDAWIKNDLYALAKANGISDQTFEKA